MPKTTATVEKKGSAHEYVAGLMTHVINKNPVKNRPKIFFIFLLPRRTPYTVRF